jgi:TPR repeat protein
MIVVLAAALVATAASAQERPPATDRAPAENKLACDAGDLAACQELGRAYAEGDGVAADARRAATYYGRACDGGQADACAEQAAVMRRSGDRALAADAALPQLRACFLGRGASCRALGRGTRELSARKVAGRARRACAGGDAAACAILGHLTRHGIGISRDHRQAAESFRRACDLGLPWGCLALARAYEEGRGVRADATRAQGLLRQACALDRTFCGGRKR